MLACVVLGACQFSPPNEQQTALTAPTSGDGSRLFRWYLAVNGGWATPVASEGRNDQRRAQGGNPVSSVKRRVTFAQPTQMAVHQGKLLVADTGHQVIWTVDRAADTVAVCASLDDEAVAEQFHMGVASDGKVWYLDAGGQVHQKWCGQLRESVWHVRPLLTAPVAIALSQDEQHVLLLDGQTQRIWRFDHGGHVEGSLTAAGQFEEAVDMHHTSTGLWVLDRGTQQALRVGQTGQVLEKVGSTQLVRPSAMALDRHGRVIIADAEGPRLMMFRGERLLDQWTLPLGRGPYTALAVDDNLLYALDENRRVVDVLMLLAPSFEERQAP